MEVREIPDGYEETVGAMNRRVRQSGEGPAGDPVRAAEILVSVAKRADIPTNLPLGVNAAEMSVAQDRRLLASDLAWAPVSRSADADQPYPAAFPPAG
jgi:hypothetical protein